MKNLMIVFAATLLLGISCGEPKEPKAVADAVADAVPDGKVFNGKWTYRSLLNQPDIDSSFNSLEFAAAYINLTTQANGSLEGTIRWQGNSGAYDQGLDLKGTYFLNDTTLCYFLEGKGNSKLGTEGWQYNYQGYLVPQWPEGVDQATVLVGSIVRVTTHSCNPDGSGCHEAGLVATTYMVKN